jgi:hypothetical protein
MTRPSVALEVDVRRLGELRLWVDDLSAIATVAQHFGGIVAMTVDDVAIDSVDDLTAVPLDPSKIAAFTLTATFAEGGFVHLRLSRKVAVLEIHGPDLAAQGMALVVERIVASRGRTLTPRRLALAFGGTCLVVTAVAMGALEGDWIAYLPAAAVGVGIVIRRLFTRDQDEDPLSPGSAIVHPWARVDAPWGQRHRDALVTYAFFLAAGIAIGSLFSSR